MIQTSEFRLNGSHLAILPVIFIPKIRVILWHIDPRRVQFVAYLISDSVFNLKLFIPMSQIPIRPRQRPVVEKPVTSQEWQDEYAKQEKGRRERNVAAANAKREHKRRCSAIYLQRRPSSHLANARHLSPLWLSLPRLYIIDSRNHMNGASRASRTT